MSYFKEKIRILFLLIISLILSITSFQCGKKPDVEKTFNVILVVIDAMRADHLSSYDYFRKTTPNIDKLASNSLTCLKAYSQNNWTCPSMASIFTGTYALVHKVYNNPSKVRDRFSVLPEKLSLISEALKENDFYTAAITSCGWVSANSNYDQGFNEFSLVKRGDKIIINEALKFIKKKKNETFFLYVHLLDLHDFFWLKKDHSLFLRSSYKLSEKMRSLHSKQPSDIFNTLAKIKNHNELKFDDLDYLIDRYDSTLFYTDKLIGELIETLEDEKISDDTIIIITADHGERFLEHDGLLHGSVYGRDSLYNEVVNIPLIIHNKKKFTKQQKVDELVESIDIFPTILDLLEIDETSFTEFNQLQGNSILKPIEGKTVFIENSSQDRVKIIQDDWSYIFHNGTKKKELYNLHKDPSEKNNIAAEMELITKKMHRILTEKINRSLRLSQKISPEDAKINKDVKKILKSLGYIK